MEKTAQQEARRAVAEQGGMTWRNNVGALPARAPHSCPRCSFRFMVDQAPIRWGLCNDSAKLNAQFKSSDLIGLVPRLITPELVGQTLGQFLALEVKAAGWVYSGTPREAAQLAWLRLVAQNGGFADFCTGGVDISRLGGIKC